MTDPTKAEIAVFLEGLASLSKKTGLIIGGCGCCGSPFLWKVEDDERGGHYVYGGSSRGEGDVKWESD